MTLEREKILKNLEGALIGAFLGLAAIVIMIRMHPNKTSARACRGYVTCRAKALGVIWISPLSFCLAEQSTVNLILYIAT
jgi:hypothetical protein